VVAVSLVGTYVGKTFEVVRDIVRECPSCRIPKWDTSTLDSRSEITIDLSNHIERAYLRSELSNWLRPRARVYGAFRCFDCANCYMEEYYRLYSRNMMIVIHFNRPEGSNTEIEFPIILSFSAPPQAPRIPDYKLTGIIHRMNGRVVTEFASGRTWTRSDNGFNTVIPRYSSDTGSRTATTFFYSRIDLL
jgi:hypothetical protein